MNRPSNRIIVLASEIPPLRFVRSRANLPNNLLTPFPSLRLAKTTSSGTITLAGYWMSMSALSSPEVEERKVVRLAVVRRGEVEGKRRCLMSEEEGLRGIGLWYVSDMVKEV